MNGALDKVEYKILSELRFEMGKILETLDELKNAISSEELLSACVFKLPTVSPGQEHNKINEIKVQRLVGKTAFYEAVKSYSMFHAVDGVSRKAAYRLPGYLQVGSKREDLIEIVQRLNMHKLIFSQIVQKIKGPKLKHEVVHSLFPGLLTKQLYRQVHAVNDDVSHIGFFWAHKFVTKHTTRDEVITLIKKQQDHPPVTIGKDDWIDFLNKEITDIQRLPKGTELRFKRPAKVSAALNIDSDETPQLSAHLPIIIVQDKKISLTRLENYNSDYRRCVRSDSRIVGKPVIARLNLYVKR
ncbi:DNA replication terminus site-binding protein [Vibrio sp. 10N.261.46.E12]|uniref:DNA replication terminus site-binding protein n=1 Tax=unclassified Vibrio TaxID=2614977 RepID=UPI0009753F68|nr:MULTISPECIES: DNA replication terminus site-binding protein [unclassified Vibrio]OMO33337.1 hypothetical protein BH584_15175 [Vibrio sp. 10N.261.45.E1]PMJ27813.1 hypothetical protein BCU27_06380 [Vibrio sp. 10N.286.45.B6]PML88128.1 hypothetical protein BCT66_11060 [Vibrio sp. 10N.261.49.E11]PMM67456.1 hypothetical protein BCT48_15535 [Vibrio sp. 10N.261.46.F12]PMM81661.1 hypothetical protein BCT46_14725 [Vibrio sp. 10N.261.46.E8]